MKTCKHCKEEFVPKRINQGFCNQICYKKYWAEFAGKIGHENINSGTVGAMAELLVCYDLLSKGWETFRAVSPACTCDLIASKANKNIRIEVRTGYRGKNGKISTCRKLNGVIDHFAIVIHKTREIVYDPEL